jgi:hypothetical protein
MAKKLILLPMDLYKGLRTNKEEKKTDDLPEHGPLEYEKTQLKKVKGRKRKNLSIKNVLYNQQLRRYLRARKETKDKPIKVQLSNDPRNIRILKAGNTPKEPLKVAIVNDEGDLESVDIKQSEPSVRFSEPEENNYKTAKSSAESRTGTSNGSSYSSFDDERTPTPRKKQSPVTPKIRGARVASEAKRQADEIKVEKLLSMIEKSPQKFGVSKGKILNPQTGKPVNNSDLTWAVKRLIRPTMVNAPSPSGMTYLKKNLMADPEARELLHDFYHQTGKGKPNLFRPVKWKK